MKLSSSGRGLVAHDPGHEPGDGLDDHERGRLPPGQHVVADRELAVDQVVGDPLVDPFVAPAQQGEPALDAVSPVAGQLLGHAAGRADGPRGRAGTAAGVGRAASTAAKSGPGARTIPAPPPKGASSTDRRGSLGAGPQVVDAQVEQAVAPGPSEERATDRSARRARGRW